MAPTASFREFRGQLRPSGPTSHSEFELHYDPINAAIELTATRPDKGGTTLTAKANAYRTDVHGPFMSAQASATQRWSLVASHNWYDFAVTGVHFERRFAGRLETGSPGFSDPAV